MRPKLLTLALMASGCLVPSLCLAQEHTIMVNVSNVTPPSGTLEISLFNSAETFMKEPFLQISDPASKAGFHRARFGKIPPGDYAVVVVHDENGNDQLDSGFLGFGGESYAFSNDVRPLFGWPDFEDVKFTVSEDTSIQIMLD